MNYGKSAYLKVIDLEQRLFDKSLGGKYTDGYLEINKPDIMQTFSKNSSITIDFASFDGISGKDMCFQIRSYLSSTVETYVTIELIANGVIISNETRFLNVGQAELLTIKTYQPLADEPINLSVRFSTDAEQGNINLLSMQLVVFGASGSRIDTNIEMRAIDLNENRIFVSYILENRLYYKNLPAENVSLKPSDFTFLNVAKSHCFCIKNYKSASEMNLYRVNLDGKLYFSHFDSGSEMLIGENVQKVFACPCPQKSDADNIVVYIKDDGKCYWRTVTGNNVLSERAFKFPQGKYDDILVVGRSDCDFIYVIASHENGSNYIAKSLIDVSTGQIVETLKADYFIALSKYIDLSFAKEQLSEHLSANLVYDLELINLKKQILDRCGQEHIITTMSLSQSRYTVYRPITYGIMLDPEIRTATQWASYCDDCASFEPASLNLDTGEFTDNGWLDRWPFNEIRPCMVKEGEVIGYLDPNDYSKFEDGTPSGHNNYKSGDVMVEFPKMYYSISTVDGKYKITIANHAEEGLNVDAFTYQGKVHDKVYIAAYFCVDTGYTTRYFHSNSGYYTCKNNIGYSWMLSTFLSKYDPTEYVQSIPYHLMTTLECLYLLLFRTTNSLVATGVGLKDCFTSYKMGNYDQKGMYYGSAKEDAYPKLFGIEGIYGVKKTYCPGIWLDSDNKIHLANPSENPNINYIHTEFEDYPTYYFEGYKAPVASPEVALYINGTTETGFFQMGYPYYGKRNEGFCSSSMMDRGVGLLNHGFSYYDNWLNGMFCNDVRTLSTSGDDHNYRITFYPKS